MTLFIDDLIHYMMVVDLNNLLAKEQISVEIKINRELGVIIIVVISVKLGQEIVKVTNNFIQRVHELNVILNTKVTMGLDEILNNIKLLIQINITGFYVEMVIGLT